MKNTTAKTPKQPSVKVRVYVNGECVELEVPGPLSVWGKAGK